MAVESTGQERGNPRMYALIENSPKEGDSPTVWAWPQFVADTIWALEKCTLACIFHGARGISNTARSGKVSGNT